MKCLKAKAYVPHTVTCFMNLLKVIVAEAGSEGKDEELELGEKLDDAFFLSTSTCSLGSSLSLTSITSERIPSRLMLIS